MWEAGEGVVFHSKWHLSCFINMKSNLRVQMGCHPLRLLLEWHAIYQPQKRGGGKEWNFGMMSHWGKWLMSDEWTGKFPVQESGVSGWQTVISSTNWSHNQTVARCRLKVFPGVSRGQRVSHCWRLVHTHIKTFLRRPLYKGRSQQQLSVPYAHWKKEYPMRPNVKFEFWRTRHHPRPSTELHSQTTP